ncbi:acyl--CoA ligase [Cellulomonas sp. Sa3CUA2]|uniref:Acyl--CoA ligase n=1 Tax=Cellulomonas avistercoris TaxID=2762242 RepID=A0ABR8Q9F4_9CELL|nr:class I adenylate-forming enzyme family protein [Cellulomonas avistercoris]MBD7917066.1 acyl--CoA ligase [Cellulomonas avistercoris]
MEHPPDLLHGAARALDEHPDRLAVTGDGSVGLTYRELHASARSVVDGLQAVGARRGDRVVLRFDTTDAPLLAAAWLASLAGGFVAVPASPRFADADLRRIARDCGAAAVVGRPSVLDEDVPRVAAQDVRPLDGGSVLDGTSREAGTLASIIYTSGTTGRTKGVACPYGSLVSAPFAAGTVQVHAFPYDTSAAQNAMSRALLGSTTHVMSTFNPRHVVDVLEREGAGWLGVSPVMATMLLRSRALTGRRLDALRVVVLAGSATPPHVAAALAEALPRAAVTNHYTLTEAGQHFLRQVVDPARPQVLGRNGTTAQVSILDDDGTPLPAGQVGEIAFVVGCGPELRTYYGDATATASMYSPPGFLRTGDVGHVDELGDVHLTDRKKDLIIKGGLNISSAEVEAVLAAHPAVLDVAVFAVPDAALGELVAAAVVPGDGYRQEDLAAYARTHLGRDRAPDRWWVTGPLPRTATGKIAKAALRASLTVDRPAGSP